MANIYIIAGEPSGDFLGSRLIANLKTIIPHCSFSGIGGPLMQREGLSSLFDINEISLMGFVEIIPHIFKLKQLIEKTVKDIRSIEPSLLITIDSPGFTYRVASRVRASIDCKIVHIVAPSVWAYRPGRALKYAIIYDHLLALLPFEPPVFIKAGLKCSYIGHPVLEQSFYSEKKCLRREVGIPDDEKVICVTAGSRRGEIMRHMPILYSAFEILAKKYHKMRIIFVMNNRKYENIIKSFLSPSEYIVEFSYDRLRTFALADIALAKSGTNTLEIAASNTPMVVIYKLNLFTYLLLKKLVKIPYVNLINIILNRPTIPELIQYDCSPGRIAISIINLLENESERLLQIQSNQEALKILGFGSTTKPSENAARIISELLK